MAQKAPGKAHRKGLTLIQLMEMFPTEEEANKCLRKYCGMTIGAAGSAAVCGRPKQPTSTCRTGALTAGVTSAFGQERRWLTPRFPSASGSLPFIFA